MVSILCDDTVRIPTTHAGPTEPSRKRSGALRCLVFSFLFLVVSLINEDVVGRGDSDRARFMVDHDQAQNGESSRSLCSMG